MTERIDRIATTGYPAEGLGISRRRLIGRLAAAGFSAPVIASILRDSTFAQEATPEAADRRGAAHQSRQEPGADPAGLDYL